MKPLKISRSKLIGTALMLAFLAPLSGIPVDEYSENTIIEDRSEVIERGQDFAVYERTVVESDSDGRITTTKSHFTLLENAVHYFADGEWLESEDLIESFPGGAVALHGPNKAIFSHELNTDAVFDIQTPGGQRIQGGVRAIQLTDLSTGKTLLSGLVKESVRGELIPPNRILYRDAFDGIAADLLLIWKYNMFSHDVILRERPVVPPDWHTEFVRLEVVTEFFTEADPELRTQVVRSQAGIDLEDHSVIHFGSMAMITGQAFRIEGEAAMSLGGLRQDGPATPVLKQWRQDEEGRNFLIESVGWLDVLPHLRDLPLAHNPNPSDLDERGTAVARVWPSRPLRKIDAAPMQLASAGYEPTGYVVDFVIIPDQGTPSTLVTGQTYYIKGNYYNGASVTFEPGCFIKFKNNSWMLLYGPVFFPFSGTPPIFTSRNDNNHGAIIHGVPGETNSNGDPTLHRAAHAIWIYYVDFETTIQNVRVRWAQEGVRYEANSGVVVAHSLKDSHFQDCQTAVYRYLPSAWLSLSNVKKCNVTTPIAGSGSYSGTITDDCGVVSIARVNDPAQDNASADPNKNSQSECSFVLVDSNRIVAAFFDTNLSQFALGWSANNFTAALSPRSTGWAVSNNGGLTFNDMGAIPPAAPANSTQGDAGDPVMARNTANGHIYLLVNPSREPASFKGFRLWKSTDNGQSFWLANSDVFNGLYSSGDKPMIAVANHSGFSDSQHVYAAGSPSAGLVVNSSGTHGISWNQPYLLQPKGGANNPANVNGADIAITKDGIVYVFYLAGVHISGDVWQNSLRYHWIKPGHTSWSSAITVNAHPNSANLYSTRVNASGNLKRSNSAIEQDYFVSNAFPRVAANPVSGRIYIVYGDLPYAGSTVDRGDIFINEGIPGGSGNGLLSWTGRRKINNDSTQTDQWLPSIAMNPPGSHVFVGYYSRQEDPSGNRWIKAYGAKAKISNGLATATFDVFPVSSVAFTNLFNGSLSSTPSNSPWLFDHVWAQEGVCLSASATVLNPCPADPPYITPNTYQNFCADDYTWASADSSYFYFAWCDRSDTYGNFFDGVWRTRADPNIRLAKIKQQ